MEQNKAPRQDYLPGVLLLSENEGGILLTGNVNQENGWLTTLVYR